ncbi:ComEC/Rec2 family competence protein [uncultured Acetatifactor sp.]|uniref:ComEC/Rec2 family competence protein n=1 Tax=uncultured Acetatifactor sp. TaxID=1671927 RepID=UPI0026021F70|nr:ComEC/Rec2 family competence protein [uncultured Acetatifactor sp.]
MKRPLFLAALFLVVIAALRLGAGGAEDVPPGYVSAKELEAAQELLIAGQVYQKDETSIYLKSVVIYDSNAPGQSAGGSGQGIPCAENFICEMQGEADIPLGRTVAVQGIFAPYSHATNPGEFDAAVYYRTLSIGGKLRKAQMKACGEDRWPVRNGLYELKCLLKERLYRIFPEKEAAVMSALLLGDKKDLDSELKDLYKRNGILHILSISSLHITIIGMTVYRLLRRIGLPICPAAVGGSVLLLLYGGMTGFSVSACRAIGMYLIRMFGEVAGRTYDMLTALGVMGAVMVAWNPYYLQSSGFLLSFSSVLGLGVVSPVLALSPGRNPSASAGRAKKPPGKTSKPTGGSLTERLRGNPLRIQGNPLQVQGRLFQAQGQSLGIREAAGGMGAALWEGCRGLGRGLLQSAMASLSITLTTLPIQLWFYYEVPVYSVFLNLFVLPLMKPMMITGLLAMLVPGLGVLGGIDYIILQSYEFVCGCFDRLPFHTWNPGCPKVWQIAAYYVLLAGVVLLRSRRKRKEEAAERMGLTGDWGQRKEDGRPGTVGKRMGGVPGMAGNQIEGRPGIERSRAEDMSGTAGNRIDGRPGTAGSRMDGGSRTTRNRAEDMPGTAGNGKKAYLPEPDGAVVGRAGGRSGRMRRWPVEPCALAAAVLLFVLRPTPENSVTFLDVGQGDCILVRTASGENFLFDCGSSSRSGVGKYLLLPYLKHEGIQNIDAVFLSHPDADHVNGAVELLKMGGENNITVGQLLLPAIREDARQEQLGELVAAAEQASQSSPVPVGYLRAGMSFGCGSADFTCLHPGESLGTEDVNAYSECFYVEFWESAGDVQGREGEAPDWTLLLTGDVQNEGEAALQGELEARDIRDVSVLKAAHHGSKNSTPKELLERLSPRLTVISSGRNNRYGHPHAELLERLEESGTVIAQTARYGAITVDFAHDGVRVSAFCAEPP